MKLLEKYTRDEILAVTGYRPSKCPWGYDEEDERCLDMKNRLKDRLIQAFEDGYLVVMTGMALGYDTIVAEMVLQLKKFYPKVKLFGALPCENQDALWRDNQKARYKKILKQLDGTRCICKQYTGAECMLERNYFMVDNCSRLIALFDGKPGGTKKTVDYAKSKGVKVEIIEP
ncbi:MAG: DUF1273 family protein [Clostridia bacterium]|nr:DUF1273 family protein [Clostridia bacterium]